MQIRKSTIQDIEKITEIFDHARKFMSENNNPNQWVNGYPSKLDAENDINNGTSYVCLDDDNSIVGTFCFFVGEDENYDKIYDGDWLNDKEYGVIHRIAVLSNSKGVASFCIDYCFDKCHNLRIDTYKDNIPMLNLLNKKGFQKCGIIYLKSNNGERIAFQKTI